MADPRKRRGRAKVNLGLSLVFAVVVFAYLSLTQTIYHGTALGVLVIVAGLWEYRRTLKDTVRVERYEAEAERNQQRRRQ